MDFESGGIGAGIVVALGILYKIYLIVNHHRVRSNCCGKELTASIDIDSTSPKDKTVVDGATNSSDSERKQNQG